MKLLTTKNTYKRPNCELTLSDDLKEVSAYSYDWWKFITADSVGNIIFNNTTYSITTSKQQGASIYVLKARHGIKPHLILNNTTSHFANTSISEMINEEIYALKKQIKGLIGAIKTKGSWKKTNTQRREEIKSIWFRIKDLRNYRDNYINKKPIPKQQHNIIKLVNDTGDYSKEKIKDFEKFFLKSNGKLKTNEFNSFLNKITDFYPDSSYIYIPRPPENIDKIKALFNLKSHHSIEPILIYGFSNDLNYMLPDIDSIEFGALLKQMKRLKITREPSSLTTLNLDKLHSYFINKINRKSYDPKDAIEFKLNPVIANLETVIDKKDDLILIKSDQDLRREGRQQSHCIGGKTYINNCMNKGYQALRYRGYTFYLSPQNSIIQTNGKHNSSTPIDIKSSLTALLIKSLADLNNKKLEQKAS